MSVADVLLPLLAGGVSAVSPQAAGGVASAIDAAQTMFNQKRQQDLVDLEKAKRASVGQFLSNLPDDPDSPEIGAARELAKAGDVETATRMYEAGQAAKSGVVTRALQAQSMGKDIQALQEAEENAAEPIINPEVGPPAPPDVVNANKRGAVAKALAPFNPEGSARFALEGTRPPKTSIEVPHLEHRMGDQGEGMYLWNPSTPGWTFDSPMPPKRENKSVQYRTDPGSGQVFKQSIVDGQVVNEEPWGSPKPPAQTDPVKDLEEATVATDRISKELAKAQAKDQADWQVSPDRPGIVARTLNALNPASAPLTDVGPKSPQTLELESQLAALNQRRTMAQRRIVGLSPAAAPAPAPGVVGSSGQPAPAAKPQTWEQLKAARGLK